MHIAIPLSNGIRKAVTVAAIVVSSWVSDPSSSFAAVQQQQEQYQKPDLYIMAMTYQPQFCSAHPDYPGCVSPNPYWKTHLTIHGLWPEYSDGSYPETCSPAKPFSKKALAGSLKRQLDLYWPNQKTASTTSSQHYRFWKYEWYKHGTCSGLTQREYFESALTYQTPTPLEIQKDYGKRILKRDLVEAYGGNVATICSKGRYLKEVRSCLAVGADGKPSGPTPCPPTILKKTNCGDEIILSKFPEVSPVLTEVVKQELVPLQ